MNPQAYFAAHESDRNDFIARHGGDVSSLKPVGEDWSSRRYFRVNGTDGRTAIVMETLPDSLGGGGAGHRLPDFIRLSEFLREGGLHAPQVFAADAGQGYAMIEDMGETSFRDVVADPARRPDMYALATDVLIHLRHLPDVHGLVLPDYFETHIHRARARVVDWYLPAARCRYNEAGLKDSYLDVLDRIQNDLPPCPMGFVHGDFHPGNLMWCAGEADVRRCGLLDFQGAMQGPVIYDMVNLLGDAQGDVPSDIRAGMLDRYMAGLSAAERESAYAWYKLLSLQFHGRVIGQVIKLALRSGKTRMMANIPRLQAYLRAELSDDMFKPLAVWFAEQEIDFYETVSISGVDDFIGEDAF
jgi:aminoglycoside/choline kinase family phosphotransferase